MYHLLPQTNHVAETVVVLETAEDALNSPGIAKEQSIAAHSLAQRTARAQNTRAKRGSARRRHFVTWRRMREVTAAIEGYNRLMPMKSKMNNNSAL